MSEIERLRRRFAAHEPTLLGAKQEYAVLCPLIEQPNGLHLLFEVRSRSISQAGEVCFPGGRINPGESPAACALRETEEELSIPKEEIELLGTPDFICNQRGFLLRPLLGMVSSAGFHALKPFSDEVADVFTVPLSFFRDTPPLSYSYDLLPRVPEDFPYETVGISPDYPWNHGKVDVPIWQWRTHVIWGMTARLTRQIAEVL